MEEKAVLYPDFSLQKPLEIYVDVLERLGPRTLPLLMNYTEISIAYVDPVFNIRGMQAVEAAMRQRLEVFEGLQYRIEDFCWSRRQPQAYIRWRMHYKESAGLLRSPVDKSVDGVLVLAFSPKGKVISHEEFWADTTPFIKKIKPD